MKELLVMVGITFAPIARSSAADGKQAFLDNNCNRCHSVSSQDIEATVKSKSMRGPDLSSIGEDRDTVWLTKYLEKEVELDGKTHRINFPGSDADCKAVADWLAEQKGS